MNLKKKIGGGGYPIPIPIPYPMHFGHGILQHKLHGLFGHHHGGFHGGFHG